MISNKQVLHPPKLTLLDYRGNIDFIKKISLYGVTYYDMDIEKVIERMEKLVDRLNF